MYLIYRYELQNSKQFAKSQAYKVLRCFMLGAWLTKPEVILFYSKTPKHYSADSFLMLLPLEKRKGIHAFIAASGISKDGSDRAVLSYSDTTQQLDISFPNHSAKCAIVRKTVSALEDFVPEIKPLQIVIKCEK